MNKKLMVLMPFVACVAQASVMQHCPVELDCKANLGLPPYCQPVPQDPTWRQMDYPLSSSPAMHHLQYVYWVKNNGTSGKSGVSQIECVYENGFVASVAPAFPVNSRRGSGWRDTPNSNVKCYFGGGSDTSACSYVINEAPIMVK